MPSPPSSPAENVSPTSARASGAGENTARTNRAPSVGGPGAVGSTVMGSTSSPRIQP